MATAAHPSILHWYGFNKMPWLHHLSANAGPSVAHHHGFDEMPCFNAMSPSSASYRGFVEVIAMASTNAIAQSSDDNHRLSLHCLSTWLLRKRWLHHQLVTAMTLSKAMAQSSTDGHNCFLHRQKPIATLNTMAPSVCQLPRLHLSLFAMATSKVMAPLHHLPAAVNAL